MKTIASRILKAARMLLAFDDQEILVLRYLAKQRGAEYFRDIDRAVGFNISSVLEKLVADKHVKVVPMNSERLYQIVPACSEDERHSLERIVFPDLYKTGYLNSLVFTDSYGNVLKVDKNFTCNDTVVGTNIQWDQLPLLDATAYEEYLELDVMHQVQLHLNKHEPVTQANKREVLRRKFGAIKKYHSLIKNIDGIGLWGTFNQHALLIANDLVDLKLIQYDPQNQAQVEQLLAKLRKAVRW